MWNETEKENLVGEQQWNRLDKLESQMFGEKAEGELRQTWNVSISFEWSAIVFDCSAMVLSRG